MSTDTDRDLHLSRLHYYNRIGDRILSILVVIGFAAIVLRGFNWLPMAIAWVVGATLLFGMCAAFIAFTIGLYHITVAGK